MFVAYHLGKVCWPYLVIPRRSQLEKSPSMEKIKRKRENLCFPPHPRPVNPRPAMLLRSMVGSFSLWLHTSCVWVADILRDTVRTKNITGDHGTTFICRSSFVQCSCGHRAPPKESNRGVCLEVLRHQMQLAAVRTATLYWDYYTCCILICHFSAVLGG